MLKRIFEIFAVLLIAIATLHLFSVINLYRVNGFFPFIFISGLVFFGYFLLKKDNPTNKKLLPPVSTLPLALMVFFVYIETVFGFFSVNAVVHHLSNEITTNVDQEIITVAYEYIAGLTILVLLLWALKTHSKKYQSFDKLFAIALLVGNPMNIQAIDYAMKYTFSDLETESELYKEFREPDFTPQSNLKNLVLISLESYERTYFDEKTFGDIAVSIKELASNGVEFTNISQVAHTEWTMAGMIASQCGVPLMPYGLLQKNKYSKLSNFMNNATCMSDVLNQNDYRTIFFGGDSIEFAGRQNFLKAHNFQEFYGLKTLTNQLGSPPLSAWGIHDDNVFNLAYLRIEDLYATKEPFAVFISSLDTHNPKGMPSPSCRKKFGNQYKEELTLSIKCADYFTTELIDKIKNSPNFKNTVFVILSDHLAMNNTLMDKLENSNLDRNNLFIILGDDIKPGEKIEKPGSMIDVYPTIMSTIGFNNQEKTANLGRSLFSQNPTLVEKFGIKKLNRLINNEQRLQSDLWKINPPDEQPS